MSFILTNTYFTLTKYMSSITNTRTVTANTSGHLWWCIWARLGITTVRAARHDGIAGVQHSVRCGLPKTTRSGAKGPGGESEAHRGLGLGQNARMMTGGVVLRRRRVGFSRAGGYRRAPTFWSPWITSGVACEGAKGVSLTCGLPAATNCSGVAYGLPKSERRKGQCRGLGEVGGAEAA
jgi:hypothetical protein